LRLVGRGLSNTTRNTLKRRAFGSGAFATYAQTYAYAGATLGVLDARARALWVQKNPV
jgi:hypothetical protein